MKIIVTNFIYDVSDSVIEWMWFTLWWVGKRLISMVAVRYWFVFWRVRFGSHWKGDGWDKVTPPGGHLWSCLVRALQNPSVNIPWNCIDLWSSEKVPLLRSALQRLTLPKTSLKHSLNFRLPLWIFSKTVNSYYRYDPMTCTKWSKKRFCVVNIAWEAMPLCASIVFTPS
jgi:hypothetical protein